MTTMRLAHAATRAAMPVLLSLALAGCTSPAPHINAMPSTSGSWQGRFSITLVTPPSDQSAQEPVEERAQGRFSLRHDDQRRLVLDLFSPFGQTLAQAKSTPGSATLVLQNGRQLSATSVDEVVSRALGWKLPVSALPSWLNSRVEPIDDPDWRVRVERRFASGAPRILQADWPLRRIEGANQVRLRLVVDAGDKS